MLASVSANTHICMYVCMYVCMYDMWFPAVISRQDTPQNMVIVHATKYGYRARHKIWLSCTPVCFVCKQRMRMYCAYVYTHTHTHIYICTYIHTYTGIYIYI